MKHFTPSICKWLFIFLVVQSSYCFGMVPVRFSCTWLGCDRSYSKKGALDRHIKQDHEQRKDHECSDCGKLFAAASDLDKHIEHKHKELYKEHCPIACDFAGCSKRFKSQAWCNRHRLKHTQEEKVPHQRKPRVNAALNTPPAALMSNPLLPPQQLSPFSEPVPLPVAADSISQEASDQPSSLKNGDPLWTVSDNDFVPQSAMTEMLQISQNVLSEVATIPRRPATNVLRFPLHTILEMLAQRRGPITKENRSKVVEFLRETSPLSKNSENLNAYDVIRKHAKDLGRFRLLFHILDKAIDSSLVLRQRCGYVEEEHLLIRATMKMLLIDDWEKFKESISVVLAIVDDFDLIHLQLHGKPLICSFMRMALVWDKQKAPPEISQQVRLLSQRISEKYEHRMHEIEDEWVRQW